MIDRLGRVVLAWTESAPQESGRTGVEDDAFSHNVGVIRVARTVR
jgi:hypothetical protein